MSDSSDGVIAFFIIAFFCLGLGLGCAGGRDFQRQMDRVCAAEFDSASTMADSVKVIRRDDHCGHFILEVKL